MAWCSFWLFPFSKLTSFICFFTLTGRLEKQIKYKMLYLLNFPVLCFPNTIFICLCKVYSNKWKGQDFWAWLLEYVFENRLSIGAFFWHSSTALFFDTYPKLWANVKMTNYYSCNLEKSIYLWYTPLIEVLCYYGITIKVGCSLY